MKISFKTAALLTALVILTAGMLFAASTQMRLFIDNRPAQVEILSDRGRLYVSLADLAREMPGRFVIDTAGKRVDVFTEKTGGEEAAPAMDAQGGGVRGQIFLKGVSGTEFPLKNARVALYLFNPDMPEEQALALFKSFAKGLGNEYEQTHGKVREARTDAGGRFFLPQVPAGDYELTAFHPAPGARAGRFWRKRIKVDKSPVSETRFDWKDAYGF
jgi:hypothetical protein